jgi:enamine deaminase RidA (YjgF/YER057c/UK114 family)
MSIQRLNPDTLHKNPAFTQVAVVDTPARFVYVGGQNGVDANGKVVGKDISSQSEQAFKNLLTALEAGGAKFEDVFKMTIYLVQGQSLQDAFTAAQRVNPQRTPPPTVSVLMVSGLAVPDFLIEIDAVAAVS